MGFALGARVRIHNFGGDAAVLDTELEGLTGTVVDLPGGYAVVELDNPPDDFWRIFGATCLPGELELLDE